MPSPDLTYLTLFLAAALSVVILVVAFVAALVITQRRRIGVEREHGRRVLAAQEEERSRVAGELHDDALQRVALIRQEVDEVRRLNPEAALRLDGVSGELEDLSTVLRTAAHQLHPSHVEKAGLVRALRDLASEFGRTGGLQVQLSLPPLETAVPRQIGVAAYRIAQEALRNVVKHAGVARAELSLEVEGATGALTLRIADAGSGYDTSRDGSADGIGLVTMRQRAEALGGRLTVRAAPGSGTVVTALFTAEHAS